MIEIQLAYEKLLAEHNIKIDELPQDAQIGIESIQQIIKAIHVNEKTGKKINPKVYDKIKANDKWVVREILDYIDDKDTNKGDLPNDAADVIDEIVAPAPADPKPADPPAKNEPKAGDDSKAGAIDNEFSVLFNAGKTKLTLDELKATAKTAYDVIFDNYEVGGDNGIETTHYSLDETEKEVFTLIKK